MDEDSDDYSDDAYEEQTNQTKTDRDRATIDQDADIILNPSGGVNLQRSTEPDGSGNIFEKSARKSLNIESNQDGEASPVQDNDVQPQNRENYSIPVDDQPEEEEQQILQEQVPEDNATDDIQNMFSYENQTFDSRDRNSNMIG